LTTFYARPFRVVDGQLQVPAGDELEEAFSGSALAPDWIKIGCAEPFRA
jgi:hypothetical protein